MQIKMFVLCSLLCLILAADSTITVSLLPNDPRAIEVRSVVVKKVKEGFHLAMNDKSFSEIMLPSSEAGKLIQIAFKVKDVSSLPGRFWIKFWDADGEQFHPPLKIRPKTKEVQEKNIIAFKTKELIRASWSKKGDGVVTAPIRRIHFGFSPDLESKGKTLNLILTSGTATYTAIESPCTSEKLEQLSSWELVEKEGAKGVFRKNPDGTFAFGKQNPEGYVLMKTTESFSLTEGISWVLHGEYRVQKQVPLGTILIFRFIPVGDDTPRVHTSLGRNWNTEFLLQNSYNRAWQELLVSLTPDKKNKQCYLALMMAGNPAVADVRNIVLNTKLPSYESYTTSPPEPRYSQEDVLQILKERKDTAFTIKQDAYSNTRIFADGKPITMSFYKTPRYSKYWKLEDFSAAGIDTAIIRIPINYSQVLKSIVKGKKNYDWQILDNIFYDSLRHNPKLNIILSLGLYEPYQGWGEANLSEIWTNKYGIRGRGNNCHLKFFHKDIHHKFSEKAYWWASYSSEKWKKDYAEIITDILQHIGKQPYAKALGGVMVSGGGDGQFQYRQDDFSEPSQEAFRNYLKNRYCDIETLNRSWKGSYLNFDNISVPVLERRSKMPYLNPGIQSSYREFQLYEGARLREFFASKIKAAAHKPILVFGYGLPDSYLANHLDLIPSLDVVITIISYPNRHVGRPYGNIAPETSYQIYKKIWLQELDFRSWRANIKNVFTRYTLGGEETPERWNSSHRKAVGLSLAKRYGWWYYALDYQGGQFFDDPRIMAEIKVAVNMEKKVRNLPYIHFRPDVAVVIGEFNDLFISESPHASHANLNALGNGTNFQAFMMETSGVPYDRVYLRDVLKYPELQEYKVYVFLHNSFISEKQRMQIKEILENKGRTIVWVYCTGYIDESGKTLAGMKQLTGFNYQTEEKYARSFAKIYSSDPLAEGVQPFMSFGDLRLTWQDPVKLNIWGAPCQHFSIQKADRILGLFGNGEIAGAYKEFPQWTSIALAEHMSLSNVLMNNIAAEAKAYRTGKSGHSINMNGNFVSIHPLFDDIYEFTLPVGAKVIKDAFSGEIIGYAPISKIPLQYGITRWFIMEK
ncbi:MAG: beta-galactosidase [Lentisphaeria bacterium]